MIGAAAEEGIPVLPPGGVPADQIDRIQQELFQYCNRIEPRYLPNIEVIQYPDEKTNLIYLKCSPGDAGPYQAPVDVYSDKGKTGKSDKKMKYWIRLGSVTTGAGQDEISELFEKFNAVPFDDRVNRRATVNDIRRGYLEDFLRESNSKLAEELNNRSLEDLLLSLEVANETDTGIELRNIALLMFSEHPERYIPGAQINLVRFHTAEAEGSREFTEKMFTGPIWKQVRDALSYIETNIMVSKTIKIEGKAEATRFFNYPFNALEEALVNAVFHKSYREAEPVEVRIYVDHIEIINFPGPAPYIDMQKFAAGKIRARKYRNRRIGEFFKEIDLSEKQATGITTILRELKMNGSPLPEFETDDSRTYLVTTIRSRSGFEFETQMSESMSESMSELEIERLKKIIEYLDGEVTVNGTEAAGILNVAPKTAGRLLNKACAAGILESEGRTKGKVYRKSKLITQS